MRKKLLPLIAIAFIVALASTALFYSLLSGRLSGAPTDADARSKMVIAARDLKPGTVLTEEHLSTVPWSGGPLPRGTFNSVGSAVGKTVFDPIALGEPVTLSRLVSRDGSGSGIPEGMRAVSVHISDSSGVVALLKSGSKVDIQMFSSRPPKPGSSDLRTILRGVTVLGTSPQPEASSQGFGAPVVTLLAATPDAEALAAADSSARLRLTLRNPLEGDQAGNQTNPPREAGPTLSARPEMRGRSALGRGPLPNATLNATTLLLSTDGREELRRQVGALDSPTPRVLSPKVFDLASLIRQGRAKLTREGPLETHDGRYVYFELPREQVESRRVRIGVLRLNRPDHYLIRPEIRESNSGRLESRTYETEVVLEPGATAIVSGLEQVGRVIVLITNSKSSS